MRWGFVIWRASIQLRFVDIVMIVNVTRGDLRDEFSMADEAFALSPISARAAQPREEDYDAISEAFMETSRGRWFLGEYAKRNRNADTRMVLDAVARIETSARRPEAAGAAVPTRLADALAAIRAALARGASCGIGRARRPALEAKSGVRSRKGARVIREISWRLARDRRRRPDLRSARFAGRRHRSELRPNLVGRSARRT